VHGIGVVRDLDTAPDQLIAKSYRPRSSGQRGIGKLSDTLGEVRRGQSKRIPETHSVRGVERREHLAAASVQHRKGGPPFIFLPNPKAKGVERAGAGHGQTQARPQPSRGGDADPQPGEGPGAQAYRDPVNLSPTPRGSGGLLHLVEQPRGVPGPPAGHGTELRLEEDLTAARGADGGVVGRRVEADYDQLGPAAVR
jgi:hypothetical protein